MHYPPPYQVPPPTFDYRTSPSSSSEGLYSYVKYPLYTPPPPTHDDRSHSRRASHSPVTYVYATPPQMQTYYSPPQYSYSAPVATYTTKQAVPKEQRHDLGSLKDGVRSRANRSAAKPSPKQTKAAPSKRQSSRPQKATRAPLDASDEYADDYGSSGSPPPPYIPQPQYFSVPIEQTATYKEVQPPPTYRGRPRAVSHPVPPPQRQSTNLRKESKSPLPVAVATAEDAAKAGIPAGFSYKNWDPTEPPIYLLGSVFDANSLGKWIYDWTACHHGTNTPMADLAAELWLVLIELNNKLNRLNLGLPRMRRPEDRELLEDFLVSGERLWDRMGKILKACEEYMWRAAKKDAKGKKAVAMGANSGREFVDSMFGRDRQLEETEKLMARLRHWTMRFDQHCADLIRPRNTP